MALNSRACYVMFDQTRVSGYISGFRVWGLGFRDPVKVVSTDNAAARRIPIFSSMS